MIMPTKENIADLTSRIELLAPAGRRDALEAVIEAGADAVYLGTKTLNMRQHRKDFHFDETQLHQAVEFVHDADRRLYVTVNALIGESELAQAADLIASIDTVGADAIIVHDLATIRLARELGVTTPLHASTMMNVHHHEHALVLKRLGVSRIITSRDISLSQIGEIGRRADIEVECFVHGDMCVAHGGHCNTSGVLFGKSANRGECMKPCRWDYDLVRLDDGQAVGRVGGGHLLALKDLCLIRHIPQIVQAGIHCMKLEGRMRDAAYLRGIVHSYRQAIDAYYQCPPSFTLAVEQIEDVYRNQVRRLSTLTILGGASYRDVVDTDGRREPLLLSNGYAEPNDVDTAAAIPPADRDVVAENAPSVELAVCVSGAEAAAAAIDAGADRVYLAAELSQRSQEHWQLEAITDVIDLAHRAGTKVGLRTPRITTDREWAETQWILHQLTGAELDFVLVHHPGTLALAARLCPSSSIVADVGFNLMNSAAVALLAELGADACCVSTEAGLADLFELADGATLPIEAQVHGPLLGMLIDHCVIALHGSSVGHKSVCRGPCRHVDFGLKDKHGQVRPVIADQHCRNHLLAGHDLGAMPILDRFCRTGMASVRIDGQFDQTDHIVRVTSAYRHRLDQLAGRCLDDDSWRTHWDAIKDLSPRPVNLGPYPRSVVHAATTAHVMRQLHNQRETLI
jgi:U32 family peptidase